MPNLDQTVIHNHISMISSASFAMVGMWFPQPLGLQPNKYAHPEEEISHLR